MQPRETGESEMTSQAVVVIDYVEDEEINVDKWTIYLLSIQACKKSICRQIVYAGWNQSRAVRAAKRGSVRRWDSHTNYLEWTSPGGEA